MKRIAILVLALMMALASLPATAEGMGVQVIGGPTVETEPVALDDFKLNIEVPIEGYGILCATKFEVADQLRHYNKGSDYYREDYKSGADAEYILFYMDITNTAMKDKDFLEQVSVTVVYDETYEYAGWAYQFNYNNRGEEAATAVIDKADQFIIGPMYQGHYLFGCTLPNAVVNGKAPLKLIITIDGHEITYHIRK